MSVEPYVPERPVNRGFVTLQRVTGAENIVVRPDFLNRVESELVGANLHWLEVVDDLLQSFAVHHELLVAGAQSAFEPTGRMIDDVDSGRHTSPERECALPCSLGIRAVRGAGVRCAQRQSIESRHLAGDLGCAQVLRRAERRGTTTHRIDPNGLNVSVYDVIPKTTYYRIIKDEKKPLSRNRSEKVFALSKVFSEALRHYHDDRESASMFLMRSHPLLGGRSPMNVARESTAGADLVLKLLDQAEAGVAV